MPKTRQEQLNDKRERGRLRRSDPKYWEVDKQRMYKRRVANTVRHTIVGPDLSRIQNLIESTNECAICGHMGKLDVDHCHRTGFVRGMLCFPCNTALGRFCDSPALLRRAIDYLTKSPILEQKIIYKTTRRRKPHLEKALQ